MKRRTSVGTTGAARSGSPGAGAAAARQQKPGRATVTIKDGLPEPPRVVLSRSGSGGKPRTVRWQTPEQGKTYTLKLPGGVFEDHSDEFSVSVSKVTPSPPYTVDANAQVKSHGYMIEGPDGGRPLPEIMVEV